MRTSLTVSICQHIVHSTQNGTINWFNDCILCIQSDFWMQREHWITLDRLFRQWFCVGRWFVKTCHRKPNFSHCLIETSRFPQKLTISTKEAQLHGFWRKLSINRNPKWVKFSRNTSLFQCVVVYFLSITVCFGQQTTQTELVKLIARNDKLVRDYAVASFIVINRLVFMAKKQKQQQQQP